MKIGIVGAGKIGGTLARALGGAGHEVALANSRGPETILEVAETVGARAVHAATAIQQSDVVIMSIPFASIPGLAPLYVDAPHETVVIDTSNYFPFRDGTTIDFGGSTESQWVSEVIGRPVVKAWNSVLAGSLATKGTPAGSPQRIALPVAGDEPSARQMGLELMETSGFDALDAGDLAQSWRQEPGTPAYCTDLSLDGLRVALARADRSRKAERRDLLAGQVMAARQDFSNEDILALGRKIYT